MFSKSGYAALREGAGLLNRSDRGRLKLTGADRASYLQGLLTNDIAALRPGTGCYAAMLAANGRMISDMRVLETGDAILLDLPGRAAQVVREKLETFIFSEDVTVHDLSEVVGHYGVHGPEAHETLSEALRQLVGKDEAAPSAAQLDDLNVFENARWVTRGLPVIVAASDDFGLPGFEVFADTALMEALGRVLTGAGAVAVDEETADVCRIEAGRPAFGRDMDEDTIPLEAGIEDRAISQTKGCYVGQEIIIRVLHRGHGRVARRLVGLVLEASPPEGGTRIVANGKDVGIITSAAFSPALKRAIALGYVHRDHVQPGTRLEVAGGGGFEPAIVSTLPFVEHHPEPAGS